MMPVWTLARELGVSSQAILDKCAKEGWHVTSHAQTLTADQVTRLRELFPKPAPHGGDNAYPPEAPTWVKIVGVAFLGLTLIFFMATFLGGFTVHAGNCFLVVAVLSLGAAIGAGFLTGAAAIKGHIPIRGLEHKPMVVGATGGVAVLLIVFLISYVLVCGNLDATNAVTVDADPDHMGSTTIAYGGTGDDFERNALENVEQIWDRDHKNIVQFRVTFKPGKDSGWFRAIHLNKNTGSENIVKYNVFLHKPLRTEVSKVEIQHDD